MIPREEQQNLSLALFELLRRDLPAAVWNIGSFEYLNGQIPSHSAGPGPRRAMLRTWAEFLNTDIHVTRYDKQTGGSAEVFGEFEGVRVRVWSAFAKRELPKLAGGEA